MPRVGTPGFVGKRLREGREARGFTAVTLAELVGVTPQSISQYEHGATSPTPDKLYLMASKLSLPVEYFLQEARPDEQRVVFYRSRAAATKQATTKAERRLEWLLDLVAYVAGYVEFAPVDIPDMSDSLRSPMLEDPISPASIEAAANETRARWGIGDGPIQNVVALIESKGGIATRGIVETETIDAFSVLAGGRPCIFLGADKDSAARSRFDAAHELGHAVLHRNVGPRRLMKSTQRKTIEADANAFAAAFLLPASGFARDLVAPTLEGMLIAKRKWVVSVGVMIHRLADLEVLYASEAERLWVARTRRGWHRGEPLDDELPIEQPRVLPQSFDLIVRERVRSKAEIIADLRLNPTDVESLAGLDAGYFTEAPPPIRLIDRIGTAPIRRIPESA